LAETERIAASHRVCFFLITASKPIKDVVVAFDAGNVVARGGVKESGVLKA
jgi:hypothetical protein